MTATLQDEARAEPNLTPILDMVFQLITFFMLVINFKSASLDLSLRLPVVGSARPLDTKGQQDLLILNIDKEGNLIVYGRTRDMDAYLAGEAQASLMAAQRTNPSLKFGDELPTTVVIRADQATAFHALYQVIKTAQEVGFRKFALKAMNREAGP